MMARTKVDGNQLDLAVEKQSRTPLLSIFTYPSVDLNSEPNHTFFPSKHFVHFERTYIHHNLVPSRVSFVHSTQVKPS